MPICFEEDKIVFYIYKKKKLKMLLENFLDMYIVYLQTTYIR